MMAMKLAVATVLFVSLVVLAFWKEVSFKTPWNFVVVTTAAAVLAGWAAAIGRECN